MCKREHLLGTMLALALAGCHSGALAPPASSSASPAPVAIIDYGLQPGAPAPVPTVPEKDVPVGTRVMEQAAAIRVKPSVPLPPNLPAEARSAVARLLTFNPQESDVAWHARLQDDLARLFTSDRLDALDVVCTTYRRRQLLAADGEQVLSHVTCVLGEAQENRRSRDAYVQRLEAWAKDSPRSATARFVLGKELNAWAWRTRDESHRDQLLRRGAQVLEEAAAIEPDPEIYAELITSAYGLNRRDELKAYADKAWALAPGAARRGLEYYASYSRKKQVIRNLALQTRPQLGSGFYAVMACRARGQLPWADVRQGYVDLLERNPHSARLWSDFFEQAKTVGDDAATVKQLLKQALAPSNPFRFPPDTLAKLRKLEGQLAQ